MGSQKPLIVPWLISQIDSGTYPGLVWLDTERTQFRIPWKHGLRQDRSGEDVRIFEAWAIASGAYDPTVDEANPAIWKRNLRSALNRKKNIRVVQNRSSDSTNPHKVYEITGGAMAANNATSEEQTLSDGVSPSSDLDYFLRSNSDGTRNMGRNLEDALTVLHLSQNQEELYQAPGDLPDTVASMDTYNAASAQEPCYIGPEVFGVGETHLNREISPYAGNAEEDGAHCGPFPVQEQPNPLPNYFHNDTLETHFEVKVYYRGTLVKSTVVENSHGFLITSRQQPSPGGFLDDMVLPNPLTIWDQGVVESLKKLLKNLEEGIQVEVKGGDICARRLGKCRGYWSMTNTPETNAPNNIDKEDFCILYTLQQFVADLIAFIEGKRKESPQYSIWMCLGELWPDERQWDKKFIMVQITSTAMQTLHQWSYSCGASSLRSSELNLQISDSLSSTSLLSYLRDLEEQMDIYS
ncbi:interferon regulatory factor 3 isoform X2 [Ascaphus truei]|uniref:interferon regulatory factor 3 isoform X2 n=1 Tax=Ascaphus truei TaxID=8439 RepID=UPI003F5AC5B5